MSTVWRESHTTRVLWITMLALKDRWHIVNASMPGLADAAKITQKECLSGLNALSAPDPHSRTQEHEGKRIEKVDGGWEILNGEKYRDKMSKDERNEYQRIKQQEYRDRKKTENVKSCLQKSKLFTHTDTDTEAYTKEDQNTFAICPGVEITKTSKKPRLKIPYQAIADLFNEKLPMHQQCLEITKPRQGHIRARWKNDGMSTLKAWGEYFDVIRENDFLAGRVPGRNGMAPFRRGIDWFISSKNLIDIYEGKYHGKR